MASESLVAVIEMQNELAASDLDVQAVMDTVVRRARAIVAATAAVVELVEGDELVYRAAAGSARRFSGTRIRAAHSLSGLCVARGEPLLCRDTDTDPRVDREACQLVGASSMVCVPLSHRTRVVGVLKVYSDEREAFDDADVQVLTLLSGVIASHISHAADYQEHAHFSRHDSLTELPNRRAFDERLGAEAARVRRHDDQVVLCLLDLDRFKNVNDTLGHQAGDEVLRAFARHLDAMRGEDGAYRLGGDEFALVLVGATLDGARAVADRLAAAIAGDPACQGIGVSWGLAVLEGDAEAALARADEELYEAKSGARR